MRSLFAAGPVRIYRKFHILGYTQEACPGCTFLEEETLGVVTKEIRKYKNGKVKKVCFVCEFREKEKVETPEGII